MVEVLFQIFSLLSLVFGIVAGEAITYKIFGVPKPKVILVDIVLFVILISMVFTALGTLLATKLSDMHAFPIIMNFLIMPIFFLSGALFPLKGFPAPVLALMKLNPLLYGVDGLRGALVSGAHLGLLTDFAVLSIVSLVFIAIGSYFFSKVEI